MGKNITEDHVSEDGSSDFTNVLNERMILISVIVLEIFWAFFAFIQPNGGLYNGGFKIFVETDRIDIDNIMSFALAFSHGIVTIITIVLALYYREHERVKGLSVFLTILFGYSLTVTIIKATSNFVIVFFTISFIPMLYYYYFQYGEISSFLGNRVVVFALRRSLAVIPMFLAIAAFTFFGINFIGDPIQIATARVRFGKKELQDQLKRQFGLVNDQGEEIPTFIRFINWIWDFLHGNFGDSYETRIPVTKELQGLLWETLKMQLLAITLSFVFSVIVGMAAAYYHRTIADSAVSAIALLGLSMPIFVSGILAILIFGGIGLGWFPVAKAHGIPSQIAQDYNCGACTSKPGEYWTEGIGTNWFKLGWWGTLIRVQWVYFRDALNHLVLPVMTLTLATMATFSRLTRSTMLEVMRQDYILAARANGLSERDVLMKHALRNVLLPLITFLGISLGTILVGAPITETVFSWPGLGYEFVSALGTLDINILMALSMIITLMILFANMITDIAYTYLDPRVSL